MQKGVLRHPLTARPTADDFTLVEASAPHCPDKGLVIETAYVSLDPFVGSRIRGLHMGEPVPRPGIDPIPAYCVGQVVESRHSGFREGDWVHSRDGGWQERIAVPGTSAHQIDIHKVAPSLYLSALGMPGLTAWAGVTRRAKLRSGERFLVDAAAGAVGGCAGQIARLSGAAHVVGIAGGPQKCSIARETYGFDACVDYRQEGWKDTLANAVAGGVDVHFENVGVELLNLALTHLNTYGRAVICGLVDQYHASKKPDGITPGVIVAKRASVMGLVVYDHFEEWPHFIEQASEWVANGQLTIAEDCTRGIESAPSQFEKLMTGQNVGKALVKINPDAP